MRDQRSPPIDVQIPAQQVDARKRQILGADHDRHQEVSENGRHDRNQEEEHHDHAVHGEGFVVGVGLEQVSLLESAIRDGSSSANMPPMKKKKRDRGEVQHCNPLVVGGQQPRLDAVSVC